MKPILILPLLLFLPYLVLPVEAGLCVDSSVPKRAAEARGGKWTALTGDEWQFLRGIYAMNPLTPPGLPYGDEAAMVTIDGRPGGLVFFVDGHMACTPMQVPDALLDMMRDIVAKKITHEGTGL